MLFDLQTGRRRRVVQIVFGTLAAVFAISFVFFGVGSGTGGGIGDLFGGGGGDAPDNPFKEDIEAQDQKLVVNPNDTVALAELVQLHYSAGVQNVDENGALTSDGEQELQQSADAWNRYLKASKSNIDPGVALIAYQTFDALAATAFNEARTATTGPDALTEVSAAVANWKAAADTQRVLIVKQPTSANYTRLAYYLYLAGDKGGGDQAATQAQGAQGGNAGGDPDAAEECGAARDTAPDSDRPADQGAAGIRRCDGRRCDGRGQPARRTGRRPQLGGRPLAARPVRSAGPPGTSRPFL